MSETGFAARYPVTTYKVGGFNTNDVAVSLIFVAVALSMVRTFNTEGFFPVGSEDDQLNRPFTFHLVTNYGKEITWLVAPLMLLAKCVHGS